MSLVSGDKLNEIYQNGVRPNSNTYVVCSTAGNTATKTVTSTGFALTSGKHITVKFTNENTAKNLKLKVNTLGAKSLLYRGEDIGEQPIAANSILEFVYNGTAFECIGGMGDSGKILSWAAYQALTPAEQAKGDYYIYDKGSVGGVVDSTLDASSGNAIANSAVATAINEINSDLMECIKGVNWNNRQAVSSETHFGSFTCPSKGMFIVGGIYFPTAGVTQQMIVNGSVVFLKAKSSIAADYHGGSSIMVNQGDVITATDTTSSLVLSYFVPFA